MANIKRRLSDLTIAKLKPPATGRLEVADEIVPGLVLRITPHGVRSFSVVFKVPGEGGYTKTGRPKVGCQHRMTLGRHPFVGVKEAREKARALLEIVSEVRDPRPERIEAHRARRDPVPATQSDAGEVGFALRCDPPGPGPPTAPH